MGAGSRSIVGFGFDSQTDFASEATAASTVNSSGEQETSLTSPPFEATRERVCANADADKIESAKVATKTRGNSFRNSIDREVPSLRISNFWYFCVRGAPLKTLGILAAEIVSYNQQCDCFVTKRQANQGLALKEVTNWLRPLRAFATVFMGKRGRMRIANRSI